MHDYINRTESVRTRSRELEIKETEFHIFKLVEITEISEYEYDDEITTETRNRKCCQWKVYYVYYIYNKNVNGFTYKSSALIESTEEEALHIFRNKTLYKLYYNKETKERKTIWQILKSLLTKLF